MNPTVSNIAIILGLAIASGTRAETPSTPVFRAGKDRSGDHAYANFREPVVVKTRSGKLVVGVHAGNRLGWPERSGQDLAVRVSKDKGRSWGPIIVAAEHGNFSCQCHGLVYDAEKDRIIFLYTTYNWDYQAVGKGRGKNATAPVYAKMAAEKKPFVSSYLVYSDDEGTSWSSPREITSMVGRQAHFGASEGRQLTLGKHRGRLLLPGSLMDLDDKGNIIRKQPCIWRSEDHGDTWKRSRIPIPAEIASPRNTSSEARVTELANGTLLYNERTRNTGRQLSWSKDGGVTWSGTRRAVELKATQCNGSMITLRDAAGELTDTVLFSVPSPGGRSDGLIYTSRDGGKTWPIVKETVRGNFAYSALIQLDADTIGLLYETNHYRDIRFVALSVEELLTSKSVAAP
jgi:sialidase-1